MPSVTRSSSQKSSDRDKNRSVSFNKDVHVKRIATSNKDRNRFHTLPSRLNRKKPGSNLNGSLNSQTTDATIDANSNNEKQSFSSVIDYLKNFIAEIDGGFSSSLHAHETLSTNDPEEKNNMPNLSIVNSSAKRNNNLNSNPIIYAQVVCNKPEQSTKNENIHVTKNGASSASTVSAQKLLASSDSDEGVSGCLRSSPTETSFVAKPATLSPSASKNYKYFNEKTHLLQQDATTNMTPAVLVEPEQRIEPKMRQYEPKRFFDFDKGADGDNNRQKHPQIDVCSPINNRGQADGMDKQWDFVENSDSENRKSIFFSNSINRRYRDKDNHNNYTGADIDDDDDNSYKNDEQMNGLLTVKNLRKRNELSERRNLLENRLKYRLSNQRFPISANQKLINQEEHEQEQERSTNPSTFSETETDVPVNEGVNSYVEKYVRESNRFYNKPKKLSHSRVLNRYKSNPELVRLSDNHISAEPNSDYPTAETQNQQELQYENENKQQDATSYKRNRSREHIRIVQTKSLQNLMRQKKIGDGENEESEDEGFASGQTQFKPKSSKHSRNYRQQHFKSQNRDNWNRTSELSPSSIVSTNDNKPKVSGFQRVKQMFWRKTPRQNALNGQDHNTDEILISTNQLPSDNLNRSTNRNGKFIEIYRSSPDTDRFLMHSNPNRQFASNDPYYAQAAHSQTFNEHKQRLKLTPESNSSHSWFKSLDRLTARRKENKEQQQPKQQRFFSAKDSNGLRPKKNLRFFGDSDVEINRTLPDATVKHQVNVGNSGKLKIGRHFSNDSNSTISSQSNPQNCYYKSQSYVDLTKDVNDDDGIIDEKNEGESKDIQNRSYLKSTKNSGFYGSKTLDLKSTKNVNRSMHDLDRCENKITSKYNYAIDNNVIDEDDDSFFDQKIASNSFHNMSERKTESIINGNRHPNAGRLNSYLNSLPSNQTVYIQPTKIKSVSRSFSLLAPWRPRHHEKSVIDYVQPIKIQSNARHHI